MKLEKILNNLDIIDANFEIDKEIEIKNIAFHTDDVVEGGIFVAIKGYVTDGHKFIKKARELGLSLIHISEPTRPY